MNFECNFTNFGYRECQYQCHALLSQFNIFHCDEFVNHGSVTYRSDSLNQSSFIDHMFVSVTLRNFIVDACVRDSGCNFSDHLPLIYT